MILPPSRSLSVKFDEFIASELSNDSVISKYVLDFQYYKVPLFYNYGSNKPRECLIIGCEMTAPHGILDSAILKTQFGYHGNKPRKIIRCTFDRTNTVHINFIQVMSNIHQRCAKVLNSVQHNVKLDKFNPDDPQATGLCHPINQTHHVNGGIDLNLEPELFLPTTKKTTFADSFGNPIPQERLYNTPFKFIPVISFECLYVWGKHICIKRRLHHATITNYG